MGGNLISRPRWDKEPPGERGRHFDCFLRAKARRWRPAATVPDPPNDLRGAVPIRPKTARTTSKRTFYDEALLASDDRPNRSLLPCLLMFADRRMTISIIIITTP